MLVVNSGRYKICELHEAQVYQEGLQHNIWINGQVFERYGNQHEAEFAFDNLLLACSRGDKTFEFK